MNYLRDSNQSFTLSTGNGGAAGGASSAGYGYDMASTHINGFVESVYVKIDAAAAAGTIVLITSSSTSKVILRVTNPSSGGATYYPRKTAQNSTADGAAIGSSAIGFPVAMLNERITATIASSSAAKFLGADVTIRAIWS
jgi:hypothetical protein